MKTNLLGAAALGLLVAACGTNPTDRVTGGAATGAATGAGVGALGGPVGVLAGAGIGAGVGAATGAATSPDQVNLGQPVWNDPEVRVPGVTRNRGSQGGGATNVSAQRDPQTRQLQQALRDRGFDPGPVDGIYGQRTRQAVMNYQRQNNMEATGRADSRLYSDLNIQGGATGQRTGTAARGMNERDRAYMGGGMVVDDPNRGTGQTGSTMGTSSGGMGTTGMNRGANTGTGGVIGTPGASGSVGTGGTTGGAGGPLGNQSRGLPQTGSGTGIGGTLGGGAGARPGTAASPDNPGTGSNSAGSSSQ